MASSPQVLHNHHTESSVISIFSINQFMQQLIYIHEETNHINVAKIHLPNWQFYLPQAAGCQAKNKIIDI